MAASDDAFLAGKVTTCGRFEFSMQPSAVLGTGSHSEVFAGRDLATGSAVAVKLYNRGYAHAHEEADLLLRLPQHEHVANTIARSEWRDVHSNRRPVLVMRLYASDMQAVLASAGAPLSEPSAAHIIFQVLQALAHLHKHGIAHHDVKLENVYVNRDSTAALGDFDLAARMDTRTDQEDATIPFVRAVKRGTLAYLPPELRLAARHALVEFHPARGDVWALGVLALYLLTLHGVDIEGGVLRPVARAALLQLSPAGQDFLNVCLAPSPHDRPTCVRLLKHPWFASRKSGSLTFRSLKGTLPGTSTQALASPLGRRLQKWLCCRLSANNLARIVPEPPTPADPVQAVIQSVICEPDHRTPRRSVESTPARSFHKPGFALPSTEIMEASSLSLLTLTSPSRTPTKTPMVSLRPQASFLTFESKAEDAQDVNVETLE